MLQINCVSSLLDKESLFNSTTQSQFGFCASERAGRSGSFTSLGQSIAASLLTTHTATNDVIIMDNYFPSNEDFARENLCLMANAMSTYKAHAQSANSAQCEQHAPRDPSTCIWTTAKVNCAFKTWAHTARNVQIHPLMQGTFCPERKQ